MSVFRAIFTEELEVRNPLILLHSESTTASADIHDIGFTGQYYDGSNICYTGLFRDATDSHFKLFQSLQVLPTVDTGIVDTAGTGFSLASLDILDLNATGNVNVSGNVVITGDLTINGTTTTVNTATLTVEDNIIIANAGPSQKEDAGFVVRRTPVGVTAETAKQSGTASDAGTTTTITLQAANNHGIVLDYYKGWIIKLDGDSTGTSVVLSSTASDPPVLTLETAASAITSTSTTYNLYNKQYVGTIFDESEDLLTFYGFPRENLEETISTTDPNGNLADFMNIKANDIISAGTMSANAMDSTTTITAVGDITTSTGDLIATTGDVSGNTITSTTTVTAGTDVIATNNISTTTGSITAATTVTAGTGITATTGDIVASAGNISTTVGSISSATTLTAGTGITATTGDISTLSGNITSSGTITAGTGLTVTSGDLNVSSGNATISGNLEVNDLQVNGTFVYAGSTLQTSKTQIAATTFIADDIINFDIIYLNPTADTVYNLPEISTLALAVNKSKITMFVNLSSFKATVARSGADTIEGLTVLALTRVYSKTLLFASSELPTVWGIKG